MSAELLALLPADLFNPARLLPRDEDGFTFHPDLEAIIAGLGVGDEGEACDQFIKDMGYEACNIYFEEGVGDEIADRYFFGEKKDALRNWQPSTPKGEGWLLLCIIDSEDGPVACYARLNPEGATA